MGISDLLPSWIQVAGIHLIRTDSNEFLLMAEYMYHCFLIHSSADGHLGCFHVLAMISSEMDETGAHYTE